MGSIPWDLIVSKETTIAKEYSYPLCGEFDAVLMSKVIAVNITMKVLSMSASCNTCGVLAGTIPKQLCGAGIPVPLYHRGYA